MGITWFWIGDGARAPPQVAVTSNKANRALTPNYFFTPSSVS
jgi:hypothetical protein